MNEFESLEAVAKELGDGGAFNPDVEFETVGELVDALVEVGRMPQVIAFHDEHLGLKNRLSPELLNSSLSNINSSEYESEIGDILEEANQIIPLSKRELSEGDIEEIREDQASRGNY